MKNIQSNLVVRILTVIAIIILIAIGTYFYIRHSSNSQPTNQVNNEVASSTMLGTSTSTTATSTSTHPSVSVGDGLNLEVTASTQPVTLNDITSAIYPIPNPSDPSRHKQNVVFSGIGATTTADSGLSLWISKYAFTDSSHDVATVYVQGSGPDGSVNYTFELTKTNNLLIVKEVK